MFVDFCPLFCCENRCQLLVPHSICRNRVGELFFKYSALAVLLLQHYICRVVYLFAETLCGIMDTTCGSHAHSCHTSYYLCGIEQDMSGLHLKLCLETLNCNSWGRKISSSSWTTVLITSALQMKLCLLQLWSRFSFFLLRLIVSVCKCKCHSDYNFSFWVCFAKCLLRWSGYWCSLAPF